MKRKNVLKSDCIALLALKMKLLIVVPLEEKGEEKGWLYFTEKGDVIKGTPTKG